MSCLKFVRLKNVAVPKTICLEEKRASRKAAEARIRARGYNVEKLVKDRDCVPNPSSIKSWLPDGDRRKGNLIELVTNFF